MFKLDFFRPFSRHGTARASAALPIRLSENVEFLSSVSRHGTARASAALPIWLSENVEFLSSISRLGNSSRLDCTRLNGMVGLSFEQVGREAIRPGCPTFGSEIHAVVHSSGFVFLKVLGLVVYGRFSASA